ncbi:hypothetical protein LA080_014411 [Diaporthe eres]|nr:hypothetical protein LA080_014411 [Diaporthe eres]
MLGESFSVDRDLVQPEAGARSKMDGQSVTQQRQRQQQPTLQQLGIALINSEKPGRQPRRSAPRRLRIPVNMRLMSGQPVRAVAMPGMASCSGAQSSCQGCLEWNVVSSDLVTAGGQIVLAQGLAAETTSRSHEPRWSGQARVESDSADQRG